MYCTKAKEIIQHHFSSFPKQCLYICNKYLIAIVIVKIFRENKNPRQKGKLYSCIKKW